MISKRGQEKGGHLYWGNTHADEESFAAHSSEEQLHRRALTNEIIINHGQPGEATVVSDGGGYSTAGGLQSHSISSNKTVECLGVLLSVGCSLATASLVDKGIEVASREALVVTVDRRKIGAGGDDLEQNKTMSQGQ